MTSREVGFEASPWVQFGFSVLSLQSYADLQLVEFVDKWSPLLPKVFNRTLQEYFAALGAIDEADALPGRDVSEYLLQLLNSSDNLTVCIGATYGLRGAAERHGQTANAPLRHASDRRTAVRLRLACAWSLANRIGPDASVSNAFAAWIDEPPGSQLCGVAAQALACALAAERMA